MFWFTRDDCDTEKEEALSTRQCPNQLGWVDTSPSVKYVHGTCKLLKTWKNEKIWTPRKGKNAPCCIDWPSVIEEEPEEDLKKPKKVFEDNFRREDDEEELKKKIKWLAITSTLSD